MRRTIARIVEPFYDRLSGGYDAGAWLISAGLWYEWVYTAERFIAGQPVLEVGCGRGRLLERLARRGVAVVGVDRSPAMADAARRRLARAGLPGNVHRADARELPLPAAAVGTIVNTFPAGYVADPRTWAEYARVLRPGGRWVVVEGPSLPRPLLRLLGQRRLERLREALRDPLHLPPELAVDRGLFRHQHLHAARVGSTRVIVRTLERT